jgi:hypothetical protein
MSAFEVDPAQILRQVNEFTSRYRELFLRNSPFILAAMLYVSFLVLSHVYYSPSYSACVNSAGIPMMICVVITNCLFLACLVLFFAKKFLPDKAMVGSTEGLTTMLWVTMFFIILLYGILFFRCQDRGSCSKNNCDTSTLTAFNDLITLEVNKMASIDALRTYYTANMLTNNNRISACSLIYDGSYLSPSATCTYSNSSIPSCDPKTAPPLSDYFICASNGTCVVNKQKDSYVTDKMIEIALMGGARLLDFDIYSLNFSKSSIPVVTCSRESSNANQMHNFVTLEKCFQTINRAYLSQNTSPPLDPLFIHLNIHQSVSTTTMDNVAKLVIYYFRQYNGNFLLDPSFNYKISNLGGVPLCSLLGKVMILVTIQGKRDPSPLLDELINARSNHMFSKLYQWTDVRDIYSKPDLITFNKYKLTLVKTSFDLYGSANNSDNFFLNQNTINNDSLVAFNAGCHFIMMNFQLLDANMLTYLSFFEQCSFVLKPSSLQRGPLVQTTPITTPGGGSYQVYCDVNNNIDNADLKTTFCSNLQQQYQATSNQQSMQNTGSMVTAQGQSIQSGLAGFGSGG